MPRRHQVIEKRADILGPGDYLYTMRIARRRFKVDRHLGQQGQTFRAWARKTYNPAAAAGKLKEIIIPWNEYSDSQLETIQRTGKLPAEKR